MTREDAQAEAQRRNAEPGATGFWAAQRAAGEDWRVVHVVGAGLTPTRPLGAHVESRPEPEAEDPRPAVFRNVPPMGGF
jgi:hypothetical protein